MRLPPALVVLSSAILAEALNFTSYVPECAPPCVEKALNSTKICSSIKDGECLCNNFPPVIFSSRTCFIETCNESNLGELRSEITAGWQKFCNDSGFLSESSTAWNPGDSDIPESSPLSATLTTTATTTSATLTTATPTASSDTDPTDPPSTDGDSSPALSIGAKAGIGIGVGVGALAAIGGLVLLGFRLGQKRGRESDAERKSAGPSSGDGGGLFGSSNGGGAGGAKDGSSGSSSMATPSTAVATVAETDVVKGGRGGGEGSGREPWAYNESYYSGTLAELPSPTSPHHIELPARDLRELPVDERPVELWHGVMPPELSAEAEVPRDRLFGGMRS